uniref:Uncharacterized protein n=1 Tax=Anguilla anguilla TaxID=7936 RepID=A0A0E9SBV1_ANGAN
MFNVFTRCVYSPKHFAVGAWVGCHLTVGHKKSGLTRNPFSFLDEYRLIRFLVCSV